MSLWLTVHHEGEQEPYCWNLTGNLRKMCAAAGLECFWELNQSAEVPVGYLLPKVHRALISMVERPSVYEQCNAPNGWGTYDQFLPKLAKFHEALVRAGALGTVEIRG